MGYGEFYRVQHLPPVYAAPPVIAYCGEIFGFMSFPRNPVRPYAPFSLFGLTIEPIVQVNHPPVYSCGLVISNGNYRVGYTGDTNSNIPQEGKRVLKDADLLLIDALVPEGFHISKHMNYQEAGQVSGGITCQGFPLCPYESRNGLGSPSYRP